MKIQKSKYDTIVNIACIGLLIGVGLYLILSWGSIPDEIPGHYNASGIVDRWGSKSELVIIPFIALLLYIGITVVEKFPAIWNTGVAVTDENKERIYRTLKSMCGTEKFLMVVLFCFITLNSALAKTLPVWFFPVSMLLVFGSLAFFIIRLVKSK